MSKLNFWKISTVVLAGSCAYLATMVQVPSAQAERQPRMKAALVALLSAKNNLEKASHDKGGHRVVALRHVKLAIEQVEKGIAFDNVHHGDNKKSPDDKKPKPAPKP